MSTHLEEQTFFPEDWISQSEAARLRGVSRQAISKLIKKGHLRTLLVGGYILVNRTDIENFKPGSAGRPKREEAE